MREVKTDWFVEGQMNIFDYITCKPQINDSLYFITGVVIREARVISQDAPSMKNDKYITVRDNRGCIHYIANWFSNVNDAKKSLKSFYSGEIKVL